MLQVFEGEVMRYIRCDRCDKDIDGKLKVEFRTDSLVPIGEIFEICLGCKESILNYINNYSPITKRV